MLRRGTTPREPTPRSDANNLGETAYPVKLSRLGIRTPLLLFATMGVACYLTAEDPERPSASLRGVLEGAATIDTMAFAPDGTVLATSDGSGMVQLWHPEIRCKQVLGGQPARATCVALAPGGTTLAVGDADSSVTIWDVASVAIRWSVSENSGNLQAVAFSPDGATLASGGNDRRVYLWDMATHRLKARLAGHTGTVTTVAFAPDGRTVVSGSQDGTIRCWDAVTGQARWVIPARSANVVPTVFSVRFSPDGKYLATAGFRDPAVRLWDSATGRELTSLRGPADMILSVDFAPDGATLVAGDSRGSITLWDLESRRQKDSWNAHGSWVTSVAFSADGRTLASAGKGTVKLWEMAGNVKDRP